MPGPAKCCLLLKCRRDTSKDTAIYSDSEIFRYDDACIVRVFERGPLSLRNLIEIQFNWNQQNRKFIWAAQIKHIWQLHNKKLWCHCEPEGGAGRAGGAGHSARLSIYSKHTLWWMRRTAAAAIRAFFYQNPWFSAFSTFSQSVCVCVCARVSNYVDILVVAAAAAVIYICTLLFSFRFRLTLSQFIYFGAQSCETCSPESCAFCVCATISSTALSFFLIYANKWKISQKKLLDAIRVWIPIRILTLILFLFRMQMPKPMPMPMASAEYLNALMRFNWNFRISVVWKIKIISRAARYASRQMPEQDHSSDLPVSTS